jgi:hypothetical protein
VVLAAECAPGCRRLHRQEYNAGQAIVQSQPLLPAKCGGLWTRFQRRH